MKRICFFLFFLLVFFPLQLFSQDGTTEGSSPSSSNELQYTDSEQRPWVASNDVELSNPAQRVPIARRIVNTIKNILFFLIVIFLLYLLFRVLKRSSGISSEKGDLITVISTRQLASSRFLHVVKLGSEYYLISSSDGGVRLLKELTDKELLNELQLYKEKNAQPENLGFIDMFRAMAKTKRPVQTITEKTYETVKNLKKRTDKIKKL